MLITSAIATANPGCIFPGGPRRTQEQAAGGRRGGPLRPRAPGGRDGQVRRLTRVPLAAPPPSAAPRTHSRAARCLLRRRQPPARRRRSRTRLPSTPTASSRWTTVRAFNAPQRSSCWSCLQQYCRRGLRALRRRQRHLPVAACRPCLARLLNADKGQKAGGRDRI